MRKWLVGIAAASLVASLAGLIFLTFKHFKLRQHVAGLNKQIAVMARTPTGASYSAVRLAVIRTQFLQVKKPVLIMGDSIVESAIFPAAICGHPVVNAGLSGARIEFFVEWASRFISEADPALAILVVGVTPLIASALGVASYRLKVPSDAMRAKRPLTIRRQSSRRLSAVLAVSNRDAVCASYASVPVDKRAAVTATKIRVIIAAELPSPRRSPH